MSVRSLNTAFLRHGILSLIGIAALAFGVSRLGRARTAAPPVKPSGAASVQSFGVRFESVAGTMGLDFRWNPKPRRPLRNIDAFGSGCAFLDYDRDGFQDILLVAEPHPQLFHNDAGRKFRNVSRELGLERVAAAPWFGVAVGDYDNDGWPDLCLTGYRRLLLLRNKEGGAFQDATRTAGLDPRNSGRWGSGTGMMDLDQDGDLDIIVLNYVVFGPGIQEYCYIRPGVQSGCPPSFYQPEFGQLLRNDGGKFTDVTERSNFSSMSGKGLVIGFCDADEDGRVDFYVGNDGTPAEYMRNLGGMRFRNISRENTTAWGSNVGHSMAAMGVDWADFDGDGDLDFAVSGFSNEAYALYRNDGDSNFLNVADQVGISGITYKPLGFGTKFCDLDNDGWPDLVFANGHVYDRAADLDPLSSFRQPLMLLYNQQGKNFVDIVASQAEEIRKPIVGRGSAVGDFDNDGRQDLLIVDYEGSPLLLHNQSNTGNHWLTVDVRGQGPNRLAYGATVTATAGGRTWVGQVSPTSSYLSCSDPRVHFGLGSTEVIDTLTVRWPSGRHKTLQRPRVDSIIQVTEGEGSSS